MCIRDRVVVVGDGRPFVAALVTLDPETLPQWLERKGIDQDIPMGQLIGDQRVIDHIQSVIDRANQSVSRAESVREFRLLEKDFTIESGHLTPSLKIKRPTVMDDYADQVEALYRDAAEARG